MTAFLWAACLLAAAVWAAVITYLWCTRDRKPLSVPGRDAPESPAATGPPGSDPQWWLKGEPGIPAGGSNVPRAAGQPGENGGERAGLVGRDRKSSPPSLPSNVPPGDTAVPGGASLPEGDEPAARPPQEAPAREPSPDPLTAARNAMAAVAALPVDDYLGRVEDTTAYDGDAPWNPFSDVTLTRIRAIRDGVAP